MTTDTVTPMFDPDRDEVFKAYMGGNLNVGDVVAGRQNRKCLMRIETITKHEKFVHLSGESVPSEGGYSSDGHMGGESWNFVLAELGPKSAE